MDDYVKNLKVKYKNQDLTNIPIHILNYLNNDCDMVLENQSYIEKLNFDHTKNNFTHKHILRRYGDFINFKTINFELYKLDIGNVFDLKIITKDVYENKNVKIKFDCSKYLEPIDLPDYIFPITSDYFYHNINLEFTFNNLPEDLYDNLFIKISYDYGFITPQKIDELNKIHESDKN